MHKTIKLKTLIIATVLISSTGTWAETVPNILQGDDKVAGIPEHTIEATVNALLDDTVATLTESNYRVENEIGNIDPLFLKRVCATQPEATIKRPVFQTESNTVFVRCTQPAWKIYVPIDIRIFGDAVIASKNIPKNSTIRADQLEYREVQLNKTRYGNYSNIASIVGMRAKRTIRKETLIKSSLLQPPQLIARGDEVIIVANNNLIEIKMKGLAMTAGVLGEQISVENLSSKRVVRAKVIDKGKVSVIL